MNEIDCPFRSSSNSLKRSKCVESCFNRCYIRKVNIQFNFSLTKHYALPLSRYQNFEMNPRNHVLTEYFNILKIKLCTASVNNRSSIFPYYYIYLSNDFEVSVANFIHSTIIRLVFIGQTNSYTNIENKPIEKARDHFEKDKLCFFMFLPTFSRFTAVPTDIIITIRPTVKQHNSKDIIMVTRYIVLSTLKLLVE